MIKLVVTDMDGTLLNDNHQLPPNFWEVEQQLTDKGIVFAVASGRQYYNLIERFESIQHRLLVLADNGTFVKKHQQELFLNDLDKTSADEFIKIGRKIPESFIVLCGKNAAYVENATPYFLEEIQKYFKRIEIVDDLTQVNDTLLKVTICDFIDSSTNSYSFYQSFELEFKISVSGKQWLDITRTHANKGTALQFIQQQLGITPKETLVFGDMLNDLEMMQNAHYSYAMKNAHPQIKKVSNFETLYDNNENGVIEVIQRLCL